MEKINFKLSLEKTIKNMSVLLVLFILVNVFYYGKDELSEDKNFKDNFCSSVKTEIVDTKI